MISYEINGQNANVAAHFRFRRDKELNYETSWASVGSFGLTAADEAVNKGSQL